MVSSYSHSLKYSCPLCNSKTIWPTCMQFFNESRFCTLTTIFNYKLHYTQGAFYLVCLETSTLTSSKEVYLLFHSEEN